MTDLKKYYVVYKKYQEAGTNYAIVEARGKHEAKLKFKSMKVKHDYILYVMQ